MLNGLRPEENLELFETPVVDRAIGLILTGALGGFRGDITTGAGLLVDHSVNFTRPVLTPHCCIAVLYELSGGTACGQCILDSTRGAPLLRTDNGSSERSNSRDRVPS
jgi:hypothetical protein